MRKDRSGTLRVAAVLLGILAGSGGGPCALAQDVSTLAGRGHALVATYCGGCHAVGRSGESPRVGAPAFRDIIARRSRGDLANFLSDGMKASHPAMPRYNFDAQDVASILAYLDSLHP